MASVDPRSGRCWYCGCGALLVSDPAEHIIPDAMGGTLKTDRICRQCNGRAGREIDAPFMQDWLIATNRALHSPGGHRLRPRVNAALDEGPPVDIKTGKGPWKATVRASIEWKDDAVIIRASSQAEYDDKLIARVRRDAEAQGKTFIESAAPTIEPAGTVVVSTKLDGVIWLRMAAKITLACLSKVLDETWLDTTEAAKYQGWLWDATPVNDDGSSALGFPSGPSELDRHVLNPPEHLLYFAPLAEGRVSLSIAYYGSIIVRAGIDIGDLPVPRTAWRTGPGAPPSETTIDALLIEATLKYVETADEAGGASP